MVRIESSSRLLERTERSFRPSATTPSCITLGLHAAESHARFPEAEPDIWNLVIARPVVAAHLDEFAYRPSWENRTEWRRHCNLGPGTSWSTARVSGITCAAETGEIPLYLMFLQRGVEGFDWFCGENLDQWHRQISDIPHIGKFGVVYNEALAWLRDRPRSSGQLDNSLELKGRYTFDFFMALPFVQEHVRPMLRGGGA